MSFSTIAPGVFYVESGGLVSDGSGGFTGVLNIYTDGSGGNVPEPGSLSLLALGAAAVAAARRRSDRARS